MDTNLGAFNRSRDRCFEELSAGLMLLRKMKKRHGLKIPKIDPSNIDESLNTMTAYFKLMSPHMIDGNRKATKGFSEIIISDNEKLIPIEDQS